MAFRYEKEPNGDMAIVIDSFDQGIASDPFKGLGYALSVNLETPGEISSGYTLTANATSGATLGKPIADATMYSAYAAPGVPLGAPQRWAVVDRTGQVFESTTITGTYTFLSSSNTTITATTNIGLAYWMGYLWKFQGVEVYFWNGSTWAKLSTYSAGYVIASDVPHFAYAATNSKLYFTNGNVVGQIAVVPNAANPVNPYNLFDPATTSTYTFTNAQIGISPNDQTISLAEVGVGGAGSSSLLIGGSGNSVYPWDFLSTTFGQPINVADSFIAKMISVNQSVFIFPGAQSGTGQGRGRIYITNGSQADLYYKIPDFIFGSQDPYYLWGDAIFHRNNLIFSFYPLTNAGSLIQNYGYIWALDLDTKHFRALSALPTTATFVNNAYCLMGTGNLATPGFGFIAAWDDNSTSPGIGYSGTTAGIGTGAILTEIIPIGTFMQKKTFSQVEYKLRTALASGENITCTPYVDGAVATNLVFSPTPGTGTISGVANVTFQNGQLLQFIIGLTGNSASSGCRLREIRIR